jgi:hypothetical protein
MPKRLHRMLEREAEKHGQTINAEILRRLNESFEPVKTVDVAQKALAQAQSKLEQAATTYFQHAQHALKANLQKDLEKNMEWLDRALAESPFDEKLQKMKVAADRTKDWLTNLGTGGDNEGQH